MARFEFGSGIADYVVQPSDGLWGVAPGAVVAFWDASTGGNQYTDLLDAGSNPITSITADQYGFLPTFFGPDTVTGMWADAGGTSRAWIEAHNVGSSETAAGSVRDWLNVKDYGAQGDNVTNDTAAIQAALAACPMGGIVYLPAGAYRTSAPLTIPPAVTLMGTHTNLMTVPNLTDPPCYIRPLASFAGEAVIMLVDQATGGYSTISAEHRILNLMIDGQDLVATVDGLLAKGNIQNVGLRDFTIRQVTGNGIFTGENAGFFPYSWRCHRVMLDNNQGHGMSVQVMTDITLIDCQAIGNWANGFQINNAANSQAIGCRAEWNGNNGFYITGDWATGTGSGGMLLGDCSTDRNGFHGVLINATGNPPIQINNLHTRRDGRNGGAGGGGYAGLAVAAATVPVLASMVTCYPGVDDNGTQTNSPQYGVSITGTSTLVQLDDAYLHAATKGLNDDGTSTVVLGPNITTATGPTTAPVRMVRAPDVDWFNVKQYGAVGDDVTNDRAAVQAAIDAAEAAGGGVVYFPVGTYAITPSGGVGLTVPSKVTLLGAGRGATQIRKNGAASVLIDISGPSTDASGATHVRHSGISHMTVNGNSQTGTVLQTYYANNLVFYDVLFTSGAERLVDGVEFWDSRFYNCQFESSGGTNGAVLPAVHLRNASVAAPGFGYSLDNTNQIVFNSCRWENFHNGALRIEDGAVVGNNANGISVTDCKMETSQMQGGSHLLADDSCVGIWVKGLYCYAGNFTGGYATAQNIITWSAQNSSLEDVQISNGGVATVNSGVDLFSGANSRASLRNVIGKYSTAPTGAHIFYEASSTADFHIENCYGTLGTQSGGTIPIRFEGMQPIKQVAGVVSDASFTRTPLNGTLAVDTTNNRLYVRAGGAWLSTALT